MANKTLRWPNMLTTTRGGRRPEYLERFSTAMRMEQFAGFQYYAKTNINRDKVAILRYMVRTFILLDRNLDDKAFARFVKEKLEPRYKGNPEKLEVLRSRVKKLLDERVKLHKKK